MPTGTMRRDDDEKCWNWTRSSKRVMRKGVKNNERTEQVEEQICGGQSEILVEKMRNDGWVGGGGGEVKFYIIYCK